MVQQYPKFRLENDCPQPWFKGSPLDDRLSTSSSFVFFIRIVYTYQGLHGRMTIVLPM